MIFFITNLGYRAVLAYYLKNNLLSDRGRITGGEFSSRGICLQVRSCTNYLGILGCRTSGPWDYRILCIALFQSLLCQTIHKVAAGKNSCHWVFWIEFKWILNLLMNRSTIETTDERFRTGTFDYYINDYYWVPLLKLSNNVNNNTIAV